MTEKMRFVYICSPLRGDIEGNIEQARGYCRSIIEKEPGVIPIAPHIYFTQFTDDNIPAERKLGLDMGAYLLKTLCDTVYVCGVDSMEDASEGMKGEIAFAKELGIPLKMLS